MILIETYNPKKDLKADFYIVAKGSNAGEPIKEPIANCFSVLVDESKAVPMYIYYYILNAYNTGLFKKYIKGSVVPFIRLEDVKKVLLN